MMTEDVVVSTIMVVGTLLMGLLVGIKIFRTLLTDQIVTITGGPNVEGLILAQEAGKAVTFNVKVVDSFFFGLYQRKRETTMPLRIEKVQRIEGYVSNVCVKTAVETTAGLVTLHWLYRPDIGKGVLTH